MGDPMVSSSTGAMNSLLDKLGVVENQYPHLAEGVRESLKSLSDVLHSFARQRRRNSLINEWMLQVREVVYDMEDWIDGDPSKLGEEFHVEEQIEEFKAQIQGARDRCTRYGLLSTAPHTTCALQVQVQDDAEAETMDPKLLHGEAPCRLVGIDEQRNVLVNHLMDEEERRKVVGIDEPRNVLVNHLTDQELEERRKVVCILGTGGIGKSTLATGIYRQLQGRFSCGAFVHLGRNPSVKTTLISILKQVMPDWHCEEYLWNGYNSEDMEAWDEKKVINKLWAFLKTKSYFVVLVDMRSISTWKKFSCVLPNKDKSSDRILITTCTKDVAESCCIHPSDFLHPMERLSEEDSKTLFHSKVPVSEQHRLLEVSDDMLEMCGGGVPLAITITAALLSRKSACLPPEVQCHSTPQWMRKVLEISYDDLPLPLKSCFLYFSAFPGNRTIKKDRLIRRWEAEGLIAKRDGESLWETGESYFNELINRRLIQPAFDDDNDEPTGCTVHGVVLDFMESLSAEENFTTEGGKLKCGLFPYERVRRICLDCGEEGEGDALFCSKYYCSLEQKSPEEDSSSEESSVYDQDKAISLHLSQVRSLAFCGDVNVGRIPDLSDHFKLVRVLDLRDVKGLQNEQLGSIGRLSLLRYLALGGANVTELPRQIMELDHLSTLDLRQTEVNKLPEFKGTKLVCLLANGLTIPGPGGGMGEMEKLEELSTVCLGRDGSLADNVAGLVSKLMRLRMLGVRFRITYNNTAEEAERQGIKHLVEEVGKSNLHFLFLDEYPHRLLDLLVDARPRPRYLRKFELRLNWLLCPLKVPQQISFLVDLTHLHIGVSIVDAEGIGALGGLPKLVLLKLHSLRPQHGITGEPQSPARLSVSSKDGFQILKVFWYVCEHGAWTGLQFEQGSMPHLRRLVIDFQSSEPEDTDFVLGIQHFSCLVQVRATIYCEPTSTTVSAAETNIRDQVSQNLNNPLLEFNRKRRGRLVRRLGPLSNSNSNVKKPSAVIEIRSLDHWWTMMTQQEDNKLLVIEFTASWCGPSLSIAPFFAGLANNFPDAIFLKVDIDDPETKYIAQHLEVDGAPSFLFMNRGEVKDRLRGAREGELFKKLQLQMALIMDN
ncbi:hypothetical protein ZWY2020_031202 [Hordeum vulgare]|nr:hypothetical protein ZWY2020_031202 [Hordeum vulgare]